MNKVGSEPVVPILGYGEAMTFGTKGTIARFPTRGFDLGDGEHYSWTEKQTAEIDFGLRLPSDKVELRVEAWPFLAPDQSAQQVFIFLNGLLMGFNTFSTSQAVAFGVERTAISSRQNRLTFVVTTATSPHALGIGDDLRKLGIALSSVRFVLGSS